MKIYNFIGYSITYLVLTYILGSILMKFLGTDSKSLWSLVIYCVAAFCSDWICKSINKDEAK